MHRDCLSAPYEAELRLRARALGSRVTFMPFVPNTELPDLYRRHQIPVVSSEFEDPCPLVLLEGMASGLATVATRRGGIPELGAGAVTYADDEFRMAEALGGLLTDDDARRSRAAACRGRAGDLSWTRTFDPLHDVVGGPADHP
jgi:glycosyltransferase involved in cell wall biosynthesis